VLAEHAPRVFVKDRGSAGSLSDTALHCTLLATRLQHLRNSFQRPLQFLALLTVLVATAVKASPAQLKDHAKGLQLDVLIEICCKYSYPFVWQNSGKCVLMMISLLTCDPIGSWRDYIRSDPVRRPPRRRSVRRARGTPPAPAWPSHKTKTKAKRKNHFRCPSP
jgi:hypothetical protein